MSRFEYYLENYTSSFICFLFAAITIFFLILFPCDYYNYNKVYNSNLSELNYIEGEIIEVQPPKGKGANYDFYIKGCDKEFYIHEKEVKGIKFNEGDYIKIHYADKVFFRGEYYKIINFDYNGKIIYGLEEFKEDYNPNAYIIGIVVSSIVFIGLIATGLILLFKNKPVNDVTKFVLFHKDKYGLTDKQVEEVIKQFEFSPKETKLDKPKEEIYKLFKDTIYVKNNRIYTSGLELVENDKYGDIFFDVLADTVSENELKVIYDDCIKDDGAIYLIYQINNKKAVINIYDDEVTKLFNIDESTLYFLNTKKSEPTKKEINEFLKQVEYYNKYEENIFFIKK